MAISTPPAPLLKKYEFIAVNLCPDPPSKRKASVEIVATIAGPSIVDVLRLGDPSVKKTAPKKK